jgi:hypothetical protein
MHWPTEWNLYFGDKQRFIILPSWQNVGQAGIPLTQWNTFFEDPNMSSIASGATLPIQKNDAPTKGLKCFSTIRNENGVVWPFQPGTISIDAGLFGDLLRIALDRVEIDERYYLRSYPDVGEALENGLFSSAQHHYTEFGYFEGRLPFRIEVDEEFYFRANPDIRESVRGGLIPSAQVHFERFGYKEGRLPRDGWTLPTH